MAYTDVDFTFGQVLTSAEMQTLSDNDASFNDASGILPFTTGGGWRTLDEAWSYSSVSGISGTVTIPSGGTSRFSIGDRVMITQTTDKYFVITAVTSTSVTITGGLDYTLVNAAITAIKHSRWANPSGWPQSFTYDYNPTGYSVEPTGQASRFMVEGRSCRVGIYEAGDGTGNSTGRGYSLPIAANFTGISIFAILTITVKDNGTRQFGKHVPGHGSSSVTCYPSATAATWTASGNSNTCSDGAVYEYPI